MNLLWHIDVTVTTVMRPSVADGREVSTWASEASPSNSRLRSHDLTPTSWVLSSAAGGAHISDEFARNYIFTTGNEFICGVKTPGKQRGVVVTLNASRGKGSPQTLYYGPTFTVVRNPKDELMTGTLHGMRRQLGLKVADLQGVADMERFDYAVSLAAADGSAGRQAVGAGLHRAAPEH